MTQEKAIALLAENDGRIAQVDAEGGVFFNMIGGQYAKNGAGNFELYLKGHAGDAIHVDRLSRVGESIPSPALTMILTGQPDLIRSLANREQLRGRGLLARFLYSLPESQVGRRSAQSRAMSANIRDNYTAAVRRLLDDKSERLLKIDGEAWEVWRKYADAIESELQPDGVLRAISDWGGKLSGAVARIAALLHMAGSNTTSDQIEPATVAGAWGIGLYFRAHALSAFALMDGDPRLVLARRLLAWIRRNQCARFTLAKAFDSLHNGEGVATSEDLLPAIAVLTDRNAVRELPQQPRTGPGRPPLPSYEVNPQVF